MQRYVKTNICVMRIRKYFKYINNSSSRTDTNIQYVTEKLKKNVITRILFSGLF